MKSKQGQFFSLQNQSETFFQKQILALCCTDLIAYRDEIILMSLTIDPH